MSADRVYLAQNSVSVLVDECGYYAVELVGCLEVGGVAGFVDDVELGAGDDLRDFFQDCEGEDAILCACDHEGGYVVVAESVG